MKHTSFTPRRALLSSAIALPLLFSHQALRAQDDDAPANYPGDNGQWDGDHFKLRTTVRGFREMGPADGAPKGPALCAPAGTNLLVNRDDQGTLYLRILSFKDVSPEMMALCPATELVKLFTGYTIAKTTLHTYDMKRSGINFGGLVVPFKFRLGGVKEIVSSATVAPYFGYRTGWFEQRGLTFTPVISAGLGLVPVADASAGGSTTTKAAFSTAMGFVIGSSKNDAFQAGFLLGKDFLGRTDRQADPAVSKPWVSFYVGYSIADR